MSFFAITVPPCPGLEAHGGPHWDVQFPDGKGYDSVYPGGKNKGWKIARNYYDKKNHFSLFTITFLYN
ncbi:hypothetical protein HYX58_03370 [Candidatus Dependentiae bacterium]|nr:hypothetical protein [Candidatus Dependentiae bacterium]